MDFEKQVQIKNLLKKLKFSNFEKFMIALEILIGKIDLALV